MDVMPNLEEGMTDTNKWVTVTMFGCVIETTMSSLPSDKINTQEVLEATPKSATRDDDWMQKLASGLETD